MEKLAYHDDETERRGLHEGDEWRNLIEVVLNFRILSQKDF